MSAFGTSQPVRSNSVEAVITRADGRVERLGVIAYWHANPLRRWAWRISQSMRRRKAALTHNTQET